MVSYVHVQHTAAKYKGVHTEKRQKPFIAEYPSQTPQFNVKPVTPHCNKPRLENSTLILTKYKLRPVSNTFKQRIRDDRNQ